MCHKKQVGYPYTHRYTTLNPAILHISHQVGQMQDAAWPNGGETHVLHHLKGVLYSTNASRLQIAPQLISN